MSLSSTSSATGLRPARVATAVAVALAVLAPIAVLCAQVWTSTGESLRFVRDERRGVEYLQPLTELLAATTAAQSAAVRGAPVDPAPVRSAIAAVDAVDARLGDRLGTAQRWRSARTVAQDRITRGQPAPSLAYTQYSDLVTQLLELNRTVGDNSRLILDPTIDAYYVMNAVLLRIPQVLVDSGRYADLSVLGTTQGRSTAAAQAQLAAARNRVATDAADLSDGLVKAFGQTGSSTLGPGLTRQLDDFLTAVDAVAPSASLLAPPPERSLSDLSGNQTVLQRAALDLQRAALGELDLLLVARDGRRQQSRTVAVAVAAVGALVALGLAAGVLRRTPGGPVRVPDRPADAGLVRPEPPLSEHERPGGVRAAR